MQGEGRREGVDERDQGILAGQWSACVYLFPFFSPSTHSNIRDALIVDKLLGKKFGAAVYTLPLC